MGEFSNYIESKKNTSNFPKTAVLCELHFEKNRIQKNSFSTKFLTRGFLYFNFIHLSCSVGGNIVGIEPLIYF